MWAKGPTPGYSRKEIALALFPEAYCRRMVGDTRAGLTVPIVGYVVFPYPGGEAIASAGNANDAWEKTFRVADRWGAEFMEAIPDA